MPGRSISIFLVDGTPSGIRTAEIGLSTIKALVVPRASLSASTKRSELQKTGVYILIGMDSDKPGRRRMYIGQADTVLTRLTFHNRDPEKDFWDEAVVFVSKDDNLTPSHVRFVEARLISMAVNAKRATLANRTLPTEQRMLPEPHKVEMEEFIAQARLLLGTLGYDLFEPAASIPEQIRTPEQTTAPRPVTGLPEFEYSGPEYSARCVIDLDSGQFIVKAGSIARKQATPALPRTYRNLRENLIESGVLRAINENSLEFSQDYSFSSITAAAQVVSGTSVNGRLAWKSSDGAKTFAQWQDEQLDASVPTRPGAALLEENPETFGGMNQ